MQIASFTTRTSAGFVKADGRPQLALTADRKIKYAH